MKKRKTIAQMQAELEKLARKPPIRGGLKGTIILSDQKKEKARKACRHKVEKVEKEG